MNITRRGFIGTASTAAFAAFSALSDNKAQSSAYNRKQPVEPRADMPDTVIVDASDFIDNIPRDQRFVNSYIIAEKRLYDNTALLLGDMINLYAEAEIPSAGYYNLYVRSKGPKGFHVAIGDNYKSETFGDTEEMKFEKGGKYKLNAGKVRIAVTRIVGDGGNLPDAVFDCLVLSKDDALSEEKLFAHQLPEDVEILREFDFAGNTLKFGDVTGDGSADIMVLEPDWSFNVYDNQGNKLWRYQAPEKGAERRTAEPPGLLWDINRDGHAEVLHWRWLDGADHLVVSDGMTGEVLNSKPWPMPYYPSPQVRRFQDNGCQTAQRRLP